MKKLNQARKTEKTAKASTRAVINGRIKQCIAPWPLQYFGDKWTLDRVCQVAVELGVPCLELVNPQDFKTLKEYGLGCALTFINTDPEPPFYRGFNNPENWDRLINITKFSIDGAAAFGSPGVICFTGYENKIPTDLTSPFIPSDEGARNCVKGFKKIVGYAEKKRVNLCMEMLNTRVTDHPMKGHPGYQGNHLEYVIDIIKKVGSPRLKLLFDVYHTQIMDGDIITRLRMYREYIGHVHVAGNPGRGELTGLQEINFPSVMKALLEIRYKGYVGQEFIPTGDPYKGLFEAVRLCDV